VRHPAQNTARAAGYGWCQNVIQESSRCSWLCRTVTLKLLQIDKNQNEGRCLHRVGTWPCR
jgi:hypothetical protein